MTSPASERRPVAIVVHAYFEEDARVRRKAEALVAAGREVEVFALRRPDDGPVVELPGIRVHHLPVSRHQGAGIRTYLAEYFAFLARAGAALARAHRRRRFGLVDINSLPDFLVFAGLPVRLVGVPLLLDLHEAMPEFFESRFPRSSSGIARWLLTTQEKLSIRFARQVVTVNESLAERLRSLGVPRDKVTVVLNSPSRELFDPTTVPERPFMADGRLRLVYAGALTPIYEVDVVLRAVAELAGTRPELDVELAIYGRGDRQEALEALAAELGIADRVRFGGRIPLEDVPAAIAAADIGLAPTRRDAFTERSLSTKIFEYAALGKPVVASALPTIERYFPDDSVRTYASGDPADLCRAMVAVVDDPAGRERAVAANLARLDALDWRAQAATYVALVDRLAGDGLSSNHGRPDASPDPTTEGA